MARGYAGAEPAQELSEQEKDDVVKEVRERTDDAYQHDRDNREDMASDFKFLAGDQWPAQVRTEREADGRPMLTINRLPQFVKQVTNDIRQADLSIKVSPVDDESDPEMAKIYNGLLRQIQYQSSAKAVYSAAAEHQAGGGFGCFRICTQYIDDTVFDQEIRIKIIRNPLSAFWDPASVEPDRSDANWWAITETWPRKAFKAKYPGAREESVSVPNTTTMDTIFWHAADTVRIAEYWRKVPTKKLLAMLDSGETIDATEIQGAAEGAMLFDPQTGQPAAQIVRMRECETHKIECFLVSGTEVLEGPSPWPGKFIPIVPVIGAEVPLEEGTYRHGIVRFARDPQQLYNFYRTASAESIALAPKAPYKVTPKMIAKFKAQWDSANTKNRPYLLYEADPEAPGGAPMREHPPEHPVALATEAQLAQDDMKGTTGIYDASLGARSNETAGVAIAQRQREGDVANYHYIDNLQRSLEHAGRILIDLIPKVYDNERVIRILGDDDEEDFVPINKVMMAQDGMPVLLNDLSAARFDIRVTIGRSYTTRRMEAADALLEFAKAVPNAIPVAGDLIAKNLDFPEAEEMAKRLKRMVPPEILHDPDDPKSPPPPGPDPMQMAAMQAELEKVLAEIEQIKASIESTRAGTIKTLVEADQADADARAGYVQEPQVVRGNGGRNGNGGGRPRRQGGAAPPRPRQPQGPPPSAAFVPEPDQYLPPMGQQGQQDPGMMQPPEDMPPQGGFRPPPGAFR